MRKFIMVSVVAATAVFWIGILLVARWARSQASTGLSAEEVADRARLPAQGEALAVLWDAPAFAYRDQNGRLLTDKDLRGHVWISDFFFTTCTTACPIMTANMAQLQKTIKNRNIEFVSFSVDPDHDTPAVLKEYAKMWKADDRRWHFLSTETQEKVAETAAGMKTFVQAPSKDTPIQHSSIFILSDGDGKVRGVYDSSDNAA
jgi:protein SCO1/2